MISSLKGAVLALAVTAATLPAALPAAAGGIGSGSLALSPGRAAAVQEVGYWYRGRWYAGRPYYNNGAAVGAAVGLGILGAAAIAGAAAAPPPPVYYEYGPPPPQVYYEPAPEVYLEAPAPRPRSCWVDTGNGGYWSRC